MERTRSNMTGNAKSSLKIREAYREYTPPGNATAAVRTVLRYVPARFVGGLQGILLTSFSGQSHRRRRQVTKRRKRKFRMRDAAGAYRRDTQTGAAWIEIYVDNVLNGWRRWKLRFPPTRNILLARVVYHEIGHHIHRTKCPEFREPENVADKYLRRFMRSLVWRRYWYLVPLLYLLRVYPNVCE